MLCIISTLITLTKNWVWLTEFSPCFLCTHVCKDFCKHFYFFFRDRVFLCSLGWSETQYVAQVGLKLEFLWSPPPKFWNYRLWATTCTWKNFFFQSWALHKVCHAWQVLYQWVLSWAFVLFWTHKNVNLLSVLFCGFALLVSQCVIGTVPHQHIRIPHSLNAEEKKKVRYEHSQQVHQCKIVKSQMQWVLCVCSGSVGNSIIKVSCGCPPEWTERYLEN